MQVAQGAEFGATGWHGRQDPPIRDDPRHRTPTPSPFVLRRDSPCAKIARAFSVGSAFGKGRVRSTGRPFSDARSRARPAKTRRSGTLMIRLWVRPSLTAANADRPPVDACQAFGVRVQAKAWGTTHTGFDEPINRQLAGAFPRCTRGS
jgi:hypothetical protein